VQISGEEKKGKQMRRAFLRTDGLARPVLGVVDASLANQ
jgi:hypothetical protein